MFPVVLSHATHHTIGCLTCGASNLNAATETEPKRRRFAELPVITQMLCAGGLGMLLLTACNWLMQDRNPQAFYLDHYGGMVAEQLARLSKDAMVREDAIALNVLAEQVASDPAIGSVTVYSLDGRTLASYGVLETPGQTTGQTQNNTRNTTTGGTTLEFTRAIQLAEATAGFVSVTVNPKALAPEASSAIDNLLRTGRPLAALLLSSLLFWAILWAALRGPTRPPSVNEQHLVEDADKQDGILLAARLFNSAEMNVTRRDALLAAAETRIAVIAELYGARHQRLNNDALVVVFEDDNNPDQRFQAACAALAIARMCNQPGGARYRYSLQDVRLSDQEQLADALLYAALANDNSIAITSSYARALERSERLQLTSEHSPMLADLQGEAASEYYLLSGANAATERLLEQQIASLQK